MGGQGVEKRVAGIVRWLDRFQCAYRSGAIESALMDAECARADLETLSRDVWSALDPSCMPPRRKGILFCRMLLLALLVVLATAVPVSMTRPESGVGEVKALPSHDSLFAWTALDVLDSRRGLETAFVGASRVDSGALGEADPAVRREESVRARAPRPGARRPPAGSVDGAGRRPSGSGKKVPYEKILSLVQTGERVLRDEEPAIKVDRGQGKGENGL